MRLRRYEAADREALNGVGAHLGDGAWDDDLDDIEDVYLNDGGEFLVGVAEDRLVAMGALKRLSGERVEIKRMRVAPERQCQRLGRRMLAALEERAGELGYSGLRLDTAVHQEGARRPYGSSGYRETGSGRIGPFDCVYCEKEPS